MKKQPDISVKNVHTQKQPDVSVYNFHRTWALRDGLRDLIPFEQSKKRENTHERVLLLVVKLQAKA